MKRTLLDREKLDFPAPFRHFLKDSCIYDSSCSPEARVYYIEKGGGYYLKTAEKGSLGREAEITRYFGEKGLAAKVLDYLSEDRDWLLTARVPGEDCTHATYLADPKRLCDLLASVLRELHETDHAACPVPDRMTEYFGTVDANYQMGMFDPIYLPAHLHRLSADEAYRLVDENRHRFKADALLHGDYCLPNIMLDGWRFSGFVDVDHGGVGDRHIDLYWGVWTLAFNLKTSQYGSRFLDAYGRDVLEPELLDVIGAAEAFG